MEGDKSTMDNKKDGDNVKPKSKKRQLSDDSKEEKESYSAAALPADDTDKPSTKMRKCDVEHVEGKNHDDVNNSSPMLRRKVTGRCSSSKEKSSEQVDALLKQEKQPASSQDKSAEQRVVTPSKQEKQLASSKDKSAEQQVEQLVDNRDKQPHNTDEKPENVKK